MAEKAEKMTRGDDKSKKWTTHDADGDIAPPLISSDKGKIHAQIFGHMLLRCYYRL